MQKWLILLLIAVGSCLAQDIDTATKETLIATSGSFMKDFSKGRYEDATVNFDKTMKEVSGADKLEALWDQLQVRYGKFKYQSNIRVERQGNYINTFVTCVYEKDMIDIKLVYDQYKRIAGMWIVPIWTPPEYADKSAFTESDMRFGVKGWELPGTLTMPDGKGPFPVVILVHGSGAHDRDETIVPNKPFKDLAWGLGSKGIAVFRYVKRNKEHQAALMASKEPFTVYKETVEDALEATKLMRMTEKIDPEGIYILGHSLGGMMIPRIGAEDKAIAGFISMAGSLRPLEDITLDQVDYLRSIKEHPTKAELQIFESIERGVKQVKAFKEGETGFVLGAPVSYWLDFKSYDWTGAAKRLEMPLLILQGERDYQITLKKDFTLWKEVLKEQSNVQFKTYAKLNHLFIEGSGEGLSKPDDYANPGHIAPYVIQDIAGFINAAR